MAKSCLTKIITRNCKIAGLKIIEFELSEIFKYNINIILARTSEVGQGLGRILSCGARKPEQS